MVENEGRVEMKILFLVIGLSGTTLTAIGKSPSYAFRELRSKECNGDCTLKPYVGTPFKIKYQFFTDESRKHLVNLTLNEKTFPSLESPISSYDEQLPLYQKYFFEDHRFQIYKLNVSMHTTTGYHYYFIRQGNVFFLLTDEPIPTLAYDYDNRAKKENERFYSDEGGGGRYRRIHYRLGNNRLIRTAVGN